MEHPDELQADRIRREELKAREYMRQQAYAESHRGRQRAENMEAGPCRSLSPDEILALGL